MTHRNEYCDEPAVAPAEQVRALDLEMPHEGDDIPGMLLEAQRPVDVGSTAVALQIDLHDAPVPGKLRKLGDAGKGEGGWDIYQRLAGPGDLVIHIQAVDRCVPGLLALSDGPYAAHDASP